MGVTQSKDSGQRVVLLFFGFSISPFSADSAARGGGCAEGIEQRVADSCSEFPFSGQSVSVLCMPDACQAILPKIVIPLLLLQTGWLFLAWRPICLFSFAGWRSIP